jgi:endonuclease-3
MESGKRGNRETGRKGDRAGRWKRPERRIGARRLDALLRGVAEWKGEREEPVVGRIREEHPEPFAVLVGTVLSLRTRDAVTEQAFDRLWALARSPREILALPAARLEAAIRPVGFYRTKARSLKGLSKVLLERHAGRVPPDLEALLALPGVGRKTANLVVTEAFGRPGICVDTHVHRILNWWGFVRTSAPDETEQVLRETLPRKWWLPINGLLVSFGQAVCRPVGPRCGECPLLGKCPYPGKKVKSDK